MTYVREQTSAELAAHMRSLQAMPGWFEPLADRLWQEVQTLQRDLAFQKEVTDAARQQQAELLERAAGLERPGVRIERYLIIESGVEIIRTAQLTGPAKWKVFNGHYCLSKSGEWEYEPMPSSRTDEFIARCRFDTAQEAIDAAMAQKEGS